MTRERTIFRSEWLSLTRMPSSGRQNIKLQVRSSHLNAKKMMPRMLFLPGLILMMLLQTQILNQYPNLILNLTLNLILNQTLNLFLSQTLSQILILSQALTHRKTVRGTQRMMKASRQ